MKHLIAAIAIIIASILLTSCLATLGGVRQSDLDAWVGVPVTALDIHSLFLTMRLERTLTDDGIEVRNYINEDIRVICPAAGVCVQRRVACNNIFYIDEGYVIEYRPTGSGGARCYTDITNRPQGVWQKKSE